MDQNGEATGGPGVESTWTSGDKDGVGTAYSGSSRVWYTLRRGHLTELYYPTLDTPQVRDVRLLITDGETFLDDEGNDHPSSVERMCPSLGYKITRNRPECKYVMDKVVLSDPHLPCVLQRVRVHGAGASLKKLKLYVVCNPHIGMSGAANEGHVFLSSGRWILIAEGGKRWLAMAANCPFARTSVGFVGESDGVGELTKTFAMTRDYSHAHGGNVSLIGEIDLGKHPEFVLGIAFGESRHSALTALFQSLAVSFDHHQERFVAQWNNAVTSRRPLEHRSFDKGNLYRSSFSLLLAHEDKTYQGAMIASLSIPWAMREKTPTGLADITSFGRGIWCSRRQPCWLRGKNRRRCEHSSTWRLLNLPTAGFRRAFGWMAARRRIIRSLMKWHFPCC